MCVRVHSNIRFVYLKAEYVDLELNTQKNQYHGEV